MTDPVAVDPSFFSDPLRHLNAWRTRGPVVEVTLPSGPQAWVVTSYTEAKRLLTDPRLSKSRERRAEILAARGGSAVAQNLAALSSHLLASDPPDHTRLRRLVNRAFTARRVAGMRPQVEVIVADLLDALPVGVPTDLMAGLAAPLPMTVIGDLLGIPDDDRRRFCTLAETLFSVASDLAERERSANAFVEYVHEHLTRVRTSPDDGLLSALVRARDGDDRLSEDELTSVTGLLITAGYETTLNLIGSCVLALLTRPDVLTGVRADPELVPAVVEETLRFAGPAYLSTPRFTLTDVECGDETIPAGELVYVSLLAANNDPHAFAVPEVFDPGRDRADHLGFGHGIHFCLGAPLARLETELALRGLLDRFDDIELAVDPASLRWKQSLVVHGLEELPVRLGRTG